MKYKQMENAQTPRMMSYLLIKTLEKPVLSKHHESNHHLVYFQRPSQNIVETTVP